MLFCSRHSNRSPGCVKDLLRARRVRKSGIQVVLRFSNSRVTKALCYPDLGSVALCGTWSLPGRHHSANFSWRPKKTIYIYMYMYMQIYVYMYVYICICIYIFSVTAADSMNASQGLQQCMLNVALHAPLGQNAPNARTNELTRQASAVPGHSCSTVGCQANRLNHAGVSLNSCSPNAGVLRKGPGS